MIHAAFKIVFRRPKLFLLALAQGKLFAQIAIVGLKAADFGLKPIRCYHGCGIKTGHGNASCKKLSGLVPSMDTVLPFLDGPMRDEYGMGY
jgi:hypothetical protein